MTTASVPPALDDSDLEILRSYAAGNSRVEVAVQKAMRVEQVGKHLDRIREYFRRHGVEVESKQALLRQARESGLIDS